MTLQTKITLLTSSTVIVICVFSLIIADRIMQNAFDSELTDKGVILAETFAESISKQVIDNDVLEATEVLNKIVCRTKNLKYAYIIGFDGQPLAHTFKKGFPKTLLDYEYHHTPKNFPYHQRYLLQEKPIFDVAYPLIKGLKAHVHIGINESFQQKRYVLLRKHIAFLSIVVIIIGILLSFLISRQIIKPLEKLTEHVHDFGEGTLKDTIKINDSGPEVSQLSKSFNKMIFLRKQAEKEKDKVIIDLTKALKEIKTLRGILPLCSYCKKIRNDEGYWEQVDVYIHKHSDADISHSICQDCTKKHHPEEYKALFPEEK